MLNTKDNPDPLYLQLKRTLHERIRAGEYPLSSRLPSQVALSKAFAVSQITVQRAIQELIDEGLLEARPGSGTYVVDAGSDKGPPTVRRNTVAIIFHDVIGGYPLVKPLLVGIRRQCRDQGYGLNLLELPELQQEKDEGYHSLATCVGAILTSPVDMQVLAAMQREELPYVLLHNDLVDQTSHCVSCNYASGIAQAATHLFDQGCERVTLITAEETRYSAGQMAIGFRIAHQARGRAFDPSQIIQAHYLQDEVEQLVSRWISQGTLPDGLICASDEMAEAACQALLRGGCSIPEQIAVVGFGNRLEFGARSMELTTVDAHNEKTGETAMAVLQQLIDGERPASHRFLTEPELIVRQSSRRS